MCIAQALAAAAAARQLALFLEPPATAPERAELCARFDIAGWVLREEEESVEWLDDGEEEAPPVVRLLSAHGSSSMVVHASPDRNRQLDASVPRRLLRVGAPESATPGLNWALGLDAARVLECNGERLDWLLSIEADELECRRRPTTPGLVVE